MPSAPLQCPPMAVETTPLHSTSSPPTTALAVAALAALCALFACPPAHAASVDDTLAELFETGGDDAHPSVELLERLGATYDGYSFAERLPRTGAYLVDTRLAWRDRHLRFPVKLRRSDDGWRVDWTPDRVYARALVELLDGGDLVALETSDAPGWSDDSRMPGLPVVLGPKTATTPFGETPLVDRPELEASKGLGRHVGRWVDDVLEGDDAPAALDILARDDVPWDRLSRVLLTAAGAGFFRLHLVASSKAGLVALPALAPVFESGDRPDRDRSLIVATSADDPDRFRISVAGDLLDAPDDCPDDWSLCLGPDDELASRLAARLESAFPDGPPSVSHVMFAAEGPTPVGEALQRAVHVPGALGIPSRKLYLGYTQ